MQYFHFEIHNNLLASGFSLLTANRKVSSEHASIHKIFEMVLLSQIQNSPLYWICDKSKQFSSKKIIVSWLEDH